MSFNRTLPRSIVHRAAVEEVFLTEAEERPPDEFDISAQLPRSHRFYGDVLGPRHGYDPMLLVEISRQSCLVLAHRFFGVATSRQFLLRSVEMTVLAPDVLTVRDVPTDVVVRCRIERRYRGRSGLEGLVVRYTPTVDGVEAAVLRMAYSWVDEEGWTARRRLGRSRHGLRGHPVPRPCGPRSAASTVGRREEENVVLSQRWAEPGGGWGAGLVVDLSHPTLFDHPLDHVPGMLQLEAFRQLAVAAVLDPGTRDGTARDGTTPATAGALVTLSARFREFAELDLPCECRLQPSAVPHEFSATLHQGGVLVTEATLGLAPGSGRSVAGTPVQGRSGRDRSRPPALTAPAPEG